MWEVGRGRQRHRMPRQPAAGGPGLRLGSLRLLQKPMRGFPALLLAVAMLASAGSSVVRQGVLNGCAVPDRSIIRLYLTP